MALTDARRAEIMAYCRIDELEGGEAVLLASMYEDAVSQMEDAGVQPPESGTPRAAKYDQCVNAMVLDAWDHRGTQTAGQALVDNPAFRRRLNQLKLTEPAVSDSGTAGAGG